MRAPAFRLALVLLLSHAAAAAPPRSPEKEQATAAFRAGKYDVACPLFEQALAHDAFDAWGWNDLALCRVKEGHYGAVLEALDRASALEKAVGDPALARAVAFNTGLFAQALVAHSDAFDAPAAARVLGDREVKADHREQALRLYEIAAHAPGRAGFSPTDWNQLGSLRLDAKRFDAALEAFLAAGEEVSADAAQLPSALPQAPEGGKRWQDRCVPLDEGSFAKCRRRWLACFTQQAASDEESSSSHATASYAVIIDAQSLMAWRTDPTEGEHTEAAWLEESSSSMETRCAVPDWPMGALDAETTSRSIVRIDVCGDLAIEWNALHRCERNVQSLTSRGIAPLALPKRDAGTK